MLNFVNKLFGSASKRKIKTYSKTIESINSFEEKLINLSNQELQDKTEYFKNLIKEGSALDDLLIEVFAVVREASKRTISLRHFDVQLIGGIILHQGLFVERKHTRVFIYP